MPKFEFNKVKKDRPNRKRELRTAELPEPEQKYDPQKADEQFKNQTEEWRRHGGRKRKNESYRNIRASTINNERMRAFETVLEMDSHNDLLTYMLNRLETSVSKDQLSTYELLLKTFKGKKKK